MEKPWQTDPNPVIRNGETFITKTCPLCFRKFRWAEEVCYDCLPSITEPEEDDGL